MMCFAGYVICGKLEENLQRELEALKIIHLNRDNRRRKDRTGNIIMNLDKSGKLYRTVKHLLSDKNIPRKLKQMSHTTYYLLIVTYIAEITVLIQRKRCRI